MKNKEEWTSSLRGSDGDESPLIHQLRREASSEVFDNCWTVKALNSDEKHRGNPGRFFWADGTGCSRAASVHVQQMIFLYNNLLFRSNNLSVYSQLSKWKIEYQLFITEEHSLITSEPQNRGLGPECRLGINQWDGGAEIRNQQVKQTENWSKSSLFHKRTAMLPNSLRWPNRTSIDHANTCSLHVIGQQNQNQHDAPGEAAASTVFR